MAPYPKVFLHNHHCCACVAVCEKRAPGRRAVLFPVPNKQDSDSATSRIVPIQVWIVKNESRQPTTPITFLHLFRVASSLLLQRLRFTNLESRRMFRYFACFSKSALCVLVLFVSPCSAQFPPPELPPPLPMHLYQVEDQTLGDLGCSLSQEGLLQLTQARQITLARYSNLKEASTFEEYDQGMRALWDIQDENIKVIVPAAGTYVGIENVIEYIALVVGVANEGYAYYYDSNLSNFQYFPNNSSFAFQVDQKSKFFCQLKSAGADPADTICETDETDSLSLHHVSFKPCTALLKQYVVAYDDVQNYLATKGARAATVCARHNQYCLGENKQFYDFMDCMEYMESIPFTTCGQEVFNGDNMLCRFKHSFMVRFRPEKHCAHIGPDSIPCTDEDCDGDFRACEATPGDLTYTPRLHERCCDKKYGWDDYCLEPPCNNKPRNSIDQSRCAGDY